MLLAHIEVAEGFVLCGYCGNVCHSMVDFESDITLSV